MRRGAALSLLVWCTLAWSAPVVAGPSRAVGEVAESALGASRSKRRPKAKTAAQTPEPASADTKGQSEEKGEEGGKPDAQADAMRSSRGPTRIDFDDRLIQGQTNKSGAVYLFDRKELRVRSMVKQRSSFRDQIVSDVLSE